LLAGWSRLLGDDDPVDAVTRAWADASPWRRALAAAESPYPPGSASVQIAALASELADARASAAPRAQAQDQVDAGTRRRQNGHGS
jgi:hypothetical protein